MSENQKYFADGGQLTVTTTCVGIVKAKIRLAKPTAHPGAPAGLDLVGLGLEGLDLVGLGSLLNLSP